MHRTLAHYGDETADLQQHWARYHAQDVTCPTCFTAAHARTFATSPKTKIDLTGLYPCFTV